MAIWDKSIFQHRHSMFRSTLFPTIFYIILIVMRFTSHRFTTHSRQFWFCHTHTNEMEKKSWEIMNHKVWAKKLDEFRMTIDTRMKVQNLSSHKRRGTVYPISYFIKYASKLQKNWSNSISSWFIDCSSFVGFYAKDFSPSCLPILPHVRVPFNKAFHSIAFHQFE